MRKGFVFQPVFVFSLIAFLALTFSSCGTANKSSKPAGDGLTIETAIVIKAGNTSEGIRLENEWLKQRYPGCKKLGQALTHKDKKSYDIITIKTEKGEEINVYFDITDFFGKW